MTINAHIAIRSVILPPNGRIGFFETYFEHLKRKDHAYRERATKIFLKNTFFVPDAIFSITNEEYTKLHCLEIHNGYRVKKIEQQIKQYVYALAE